PRALAISDLINARCLLTLRGRPSSRTVTCSPSSAARSVARLRLPRGRPRKFPDSPFLNWLAFGGRPYPTLYPLMTYFLRNDHPCERPAREISRARTQLPCARPARQSSD